LGGSAQERYCGAGTVPSLAADFHESFRRAVVLKKFTKYEFITNIRI